MKPPKNLLMNCEFGTMKLEVYPDHESTGAAAARAMAQEIIHLARTRKEVAIVFATGASQMEMLNMLTSIPDLPWEKVRGFHLDEYVGLDENHPASFRKYLRERLTRLVPLAEFFEIDGNAKDLDSFCNEYGQKLGRANPQLCALGIGENGHLAFNDPGEADFNDPLPMKRVRLDRACREQQVAEGWFDDWIAVPEFALTLTLPAIFQVPKLIVTVPGKRKAAIVRRTLESPVSTDCPSTFLHMHPDVTIYLDADSAQELDSRFLAEIEKAEKR